MFYGSKCRPFLRCVSVFVCLTFLPVSVQADNFTPPAKAKPAPAPAVPDGPPLLDAGQLKALEKLPAQAAPLRLASAETPAVDSLALSALPAHTPPVAPRPAGLSPLSTDELHQAITARTPRVASHAKALPDAKLLLAQLDLQEESTPEATSVSGDSPIVTDASGATAAPSPESLPAQAREQRGPSGPPEALSALNAADGHKKAGRLPEALDAYFTIMDRYPATNEALWADQGMWDVLEGLDAGTIARPDVAGFEQALASRSFQSGDGQYAALTYASERALAEDKHGNPETALSYARAAMPDAWDMLRNFPDHYLSMSAAHYLWEIARVQGPDEEKASMAQMRAHAESLKPSPARLGAFYAIGCFAADLRNNAAGEALNAWSNVTQEMKQPYVDALLSDTSVPFWVRGFVCEYAGRASAGQGDLASAKAWYDRGVQASTHVGPTHWYLAFMSALCTARQNPMDLSVGVGAIQDYLAKYPGSDQTDRALIELGALFTQEGDYTGSVAFYEEVLRRGKNEQAMLAAQNELDYLSRNLLESVPAEAKASAPEKPAQTAQWCGPRALESLLASVGVTAAASDLAALAGTDATGSTMQGLIDAAKAKGVTLTGVRAASPEVLPLPAIAYVNGDHFVVVTAVRAEGVDVIDPASGSRTVTRARFGSWWDGQALVLHAQGTQPLAVAALTGQKGGSSTPQLPSMYYTPYDEYAGGSGGAGMAGVDPKALEQGPNLSTLVSSPGVDLNVNGFETCLDMREKDLVLGVRGSLEVAFGRAYINEKGYPRTVTNGRMGAGWCNNLALYIKTGPDDGTRDAFIENLTLQDSSGTARAFTYSTSDATYDYFVRTSTGQTSEKGITVRRKMSTSTNQRLFYVDFPNGMTYEFSYASPAGNGTARLTAIKDAGGLNAVSFLYDSTTFSTGKLTKVQSPLGDARHFLFSYDASSRITKAELKNNSTALSTVTYEYNGSNQLTKVTDPEGKTVQYAYGTQGGASQYISSITDKAGQTTSLNWSFQDDGTGAWGAYKIVAAPPDGAAQTFERSLATSVDTMTAASGGTTLNKLVQTPVSGDASRTRYNDQYADVSTYNRWEYQYDGSKNLTRAVRPDSTVEADYAYNTVGRISTVTDTVGATETYYYASASALNPTKKRDRRNLDTPVYYNTAGRLTKTVPPEGGANGYVLAYDAYGQVTSVTNPSGQASTTGYNDRGQVTSVTDALSNTRSFEYDLLGNKTKAYDATSNATTMEYSTCGGCGSGGRLTKVTDALSQNTTLAYDAAGNQTKTTDALGRDTTVAYDTMNRVTSATGGGGTSTTTYDALGQVSTQTDPDGRVTTYYYDFQGQLTRQTDGIGNYVQYTYDAEGQVSTVTDGLNQTTINLYDSAGRLTKTTGADGKSKVYAYDSAGRVTQEYATAGGSPADQRDYYYHGTTGQLTKVTYDGTYSANLYYDASNRLTKLTDWIDATNGLRYTYDSAGRAVTLTDYDNRTLVYGYDANGRATTMTDWHGNTTAYSYTALGQVSTVTAPGSKVWDYDYNALGQPTKVTCPNTMTTEYAYDGTNRMTKIAYMDGATTVDSFTYGLTPASQITKITHNDGSYWDYGNDARGRLTTAVRKDSGNNTQTSHAYVYDAGDNMLSKTVDGTLTTFAYTSGNELTTQTTGGTTTSMYYDVAGRKISKAQGAYTATYDWRYDAKLYSVTSNFPGEGTVNYEYRGDGKRHSRTAGGSTTRYNWDKAWNEVSEGDASNNLLTTFTLDNPAAQVAGTLAEIAGSNPGTGTAKYYLKDHLGSTRRVHAADKSTLATTEFQPYGDTYATTGTQPTFSFTGKPWDAAAAMYYFPYRFYSPGMGRWISRDPAGDVDGPNLYAYVRCHPMFFVDLKGDMLQWFIRAAKAATTYSVRDGLWVAVQTSTRVTVRMAKNGLKYAEDAYALAIETATISATAAQHAVRSMQGKIQRLQQLMERYTQETEDLTSRYWAVRNSLATLSGRDAARAEKEAEELLRAIQMRGTAVLDNMAADQAKYREAIDILRSKVE